MVLATFSEPMLTILSSQGSCDIRSFNLRLLACQSILGFTGESKCKVHQGRDVSQRYISTANDGPALITQQSLVPERLYEYLHRSDGRDTAFQTHLESAVAQSTEVRSNRSPHDWLVRLSGLVSSTSCPGSAHTTPQRSHILLCGYSVLVVN